MPELAIVISSLGPSGAERIAARQASWFDGQGFDVTLITLDESVKDHYEVCPSITRMRMQDNRPESLFNYVQNQGFDLTIDHIHWHEEHFEFFELMGASKHRLVIFDHSTYFYPLYFQSKWPLFENRVAAYKHADAVSVLSRHSCQIFRQKVPTTAFIPNPLSYESDAVSPVLKSKSIIAVANWQRPEKRLDRVLEIFSKVSSVVQDSHLILVGPVRQVELQNLIKQYQIAPEKIEVVGQQDDVEPYYLRSRVFLHGSEMEGFGLVLTEAGMHGLPRVAMNSPGLDEVIEHGVDGYLVEQGDRQAAVNHLVSLLNDDQICQRMSTNALSSVQKFGLYSIGKRWEWLVNMVTSSSSASEIETAVNGDCRKQGVDAISIKRIAQDYDTQLLRIIWLFQKSGFTTTFSSDSLRQLGGGVSQRVFKSRTARLFSEVSGLFESRYVAKLVRQSGLFDKQWYEDQYPDVKSARIDPALHYVKFGAAEGRNPSGEFDTLYYLSKHRELVFKKVNPLLHFLETKGSETQTQKTDFEVRDKPNDDKPGSWSVEDQVWLEKFSNNRSLLTLLEPTYLGIRQSASQFVTEEQMLFLKYDMDDSTIDYYARLIAKARPKKILVQGFPRSYLNLLPLLRKRLPKTPIFCIYHGPFTQFRVPEERKSLQTLIEFHREGVLDRIGLVKKGMAETLQTIGVDARFVMNFMAKIPTVPVQTDYVSVGIVGSERQPLSLFFIKSRLVSILIAMR